MQIISSARGGPHGVGGPSAEALGEKEKRGHRDIHAINARAIARSSSRGALEGGVGGAEPDDDANDGRSTIVFIDGFIKRSKIVCILHRLCKNDRRSCA